MNVNAIDISFDFRTDANGGDPDKYSPTLRKYHQILWSKHLPNGKFLALNNKLCHKSEVGELSFASDSIIHSFSLWKRYQHIISQVPKSEIENFRHLSYTIGGMIIFPSNKINNKQTINGARGCDRKINDRFDLTLECIRRYYNGEDSPLDEVLTRYSEFFNLFGSFKGYVDFFLLQDLVNQDYSQISFFHPFNDFSDNPLPKSLEEYIEYMKNSISFIEKRNFRIKNRTDGNVVTY